MRASPPAVTFFADLANDNDLSEDSFFTIGDNSVPNVDMDIMDESVQSIYKNQPGLRSLPQGDESPYAILVFDTQILSKVSRFRLVKLVNSNQYLEKEITYEDIQHIPNVEALGKQDNEPPFLLDVVVYGRKTHVTNCEIFDALHRPTEPVEDGKNI